MKKQDRLENKKRKTAALVNMIVINEEDKMKKSKKAKLADRDSSDNEETPLVNPDTVDEPAIKKMKTDNLADKGISDEVFRQLKKDLIVRKNSLKNKPCFRLKFFGEKATLSNPITKRQPLMFDDLQFLLMTALLGSNSPFKPDRWCVLDKVNKISHTVVLVIEGITSYCFTSNETLFNKTKGIFEEQLEVVLPKYEKNRVIEELSSVPLTQSFKEKLIQKYGTLEAAMKHNKEHHLFAGSVFPIEGESADSGEIFDDETFPRTRLLLSPLQMMIEGYPMPLQGEFAERYRTYKFSRESYKAVHSKSPMFGLDCEMCRTAKAENELARVSIVDENYESVYETLVRPTNPIIDYLTPWSGITKEMMEDVTKTLKEVQEDIKNLLPPDCILVGQSLNCDLTAMKIMHPYVIDTSVIFNMTSDRNRKTKLQILAKEFLGEEIQMNKEGHNSIEDSITSLKLTKLKLSKDIYFGDKALETKKQINEDKKYTGIVNGPVEQEQIVATSLLSQAMKRTKKSAIITTENTELDLQKFFTKNQFNLLNKNGEDESKHGISHLKESSAKKVIKKTRQVIIDNEFNLSHFNIMEDSLHEDGESEEKLVEMIPKIDKWIAKIWEGVATNGLFVVIFGGHEKNSNGVAMIRIKD